MATTLRNISSSLEYRLWQIMAQKDWLLHYTSLRLQPAGSDAPTNTFTTATTTTTAATAARTVPHPWCFFDQRGVNADRSRLRVYADGGLINPSTYAVCHLNHWITFHDAPPPGVLTADLDVFAAKVTDSYPEGEVLEQAGLPLIAHAIEGLDGAAFAVGTTMVDWNCHVTLDLLFQDRGTRADLTYDLARHLAAMPLLDMSKAAFLTPEGDANLEFNFQRQNRGYLRVSPRHCRFLAPRRGGSSKERYRALITFDLKNVE